LSEVKHLTANSKTYNTITKLAKGLRGGSMREIKGFTRREFMKYVGVASTMALGIQFLGCAQKKPEKAKE